MNIKVITINGPITVKASLLPGYNEPLAVVEKWDDGEHAYSVVAPVPMSDIWIAIGSRYEISRRTSTRSISEELMETIKTMPEMCRQYALSAKSVNPVVMQLAGYLGFLSEDMIESHNRLVAKAKDEHQNILNEIEARKVERERQQLTNALSKFKAGETIPVDIFLELLNMRGIVLHPRSKGSLKKVTFIGHSAAQAPPKTKISDSVWLAARQLLTMP